MMRFQTASLILLLIGFAMLPTSSAGASPQAGQGVLQTQDTNVAGIVADFIECKRKEGILSVRVRFRNASSAQGRFEIIDGRNYEKFYVTGAGKKYFILKDSEGTYLTVEAPGSGNLGVPLAKGQQFVWWAKYPAPPASVKKITFFSPLMPPFEDIPITDQ
jgi:hypothetical protein